MYAILLNVKTPLKQNDIRKSFILLNFKGRKKGLASKTTQQKLALPVRSHQRWLQMCTMRDFVWAVLFGLINGAGFYTCGHISSGIMSRGNTPPHRHSFNRTLHLMPEGLPSDELSIENAICIMQSQLSPYLIDPSSRAVEWLKAHLGSGENTVQEPML